MTVFDVLKDLIAGTVGGACGIVVGHPIDTVKVRLQVDRNYKGITDCVIKTWRIEGPASFFKGVVAPVLGAAPINAVVFVTYGGVMRLAAKNYGKKLNDSELPIYYHGLAGIVAGFSQNVFGTPNELVKIKCQVNRRENVRSIQMAKRLYNEGGLFRGLYQGWWITAARDTPAFGVYFVSYEFYRTLFQEWGFSQTWSAFFAGGMAGSNSFLFTHPIDVIKSIRQEQIIATPREQTKTLYLIKQAYLANGRSLSIFTRGVIPSVVRAYPVSAVTFVIYDYLLRALDRFDWTATTMTIDCGDVDFAEKVN